MAATESSPPTLEIEIGERPINLTQVLKRSGWIMHGGEAKALIAEGLVLVNGEVELRKRRKMSVGDRVALVNGPQLTLT